MIRLATLIFLFFSGSVVLAQTPQGTPKTKSPAGRTLSTIPPPAAPADSVQFNAAFGPLWELVKPSVTVRERMEKRFRRVAHTYAERGVDSVTAYNSVMTALDTTIERQLYRAALLQQGFTTEDVRMLTAFFRSATGKKLMAGDRALADARDVDIEKYVGRLFSSVMTPMMKPRASTEGKITPMPIGAKSTTIAPVRDSIEAK